MDDLLFGEGSTLTLTRCGASWRVSWKCGNVSRQVIQECFNTCSAVYRWWGSTWSMWESRSWKTKEDVSNFYHECSLHASDSNKNKSKAQTEKREVQILTGLDSSDLREHSGKHAHACVCVCICMCSPWTCPIPCPSCPLSERTFQILSGGGSPLVCRLAR